MPVGVDRLSPYLGVLRARVLHDSVVFPHYLIPPDAAFAARPPLAAAMAPVVAIERSPLLAELPLVTSIEASSPHLSDDNIPEINNGITASVHSPTSVMDSTFRSRAANRRDVGNAYGGKHPQDSARDHGIKE